MGLVVIILRHWGGIAKVVVQAYRYKPVTFLPPLFSVRAFPFHGLCSRLSVQSFPGGMHSSAWPLRL